MVVIILAIIGLGWKSFSLGVITGVEKAVDIGYWYRSYDQVSIIQVIILGVIKHTLLGK